MQSQSDMCDTQAITCPSGLAGIIRNMTVGEARLLTGKNRENTSQVNKLLSACWVETSDPGPYRIDDGGLRWGDALQGDRFYALTQIRVLTYGDDYDFAVPCKNRTCARRIDWSLKLSHLPVRMLADASRQKFMQGNSFEIELPEGRKGTFGLATGKDEAQMANLHQRDDGMLLPSLLNLRLREVSGVPPLQKLAYLNRLSLRQARDLFASFDKADCGVETNVDVECPHCGYTQRVDLPLEQGFLWPESPAASSRSTP